LIDQYGWSDALSHDFAPHAALGLIPGRVLVQQRGQYDIITDAGELTAEITGRLARDAPEGGLPVVGDWVAVAPKPGEAAATIHAVLPRRTGFARKAAGQDQTTQVVAANVDLALLVAALNADFNPRRLERYLTAARQSGATPVIVLTKADLLDGGAEAVEAARAVALDAQVLAVSALTGQGMDDLRALLAPGVTALLVGSSGAGKSTLVNALAGSERMAVGDIREGDARGRHTTTHRELVLLPSGALILDTPGMRELGLLDADEAVAATFEDIEALALTCRFRDCGHGTEPDCAVRAALEAGQLDPARWRNYDKLAREAAFSDRKEDRAAREVERRRWIAISKAQRAGRKKRDVE
jgi:ribosome biogenesis GTPase